MPSVRSTIAIEDLCRQRLAAGDAVDQRGGLAPAEPAQGQRGHLRLAGPGRLEFRAEGDDHQYRQPPHALGDPLQQFERG